MDFIFHINLSVPVWITDILIFILTDSPWANDEIYPVSLQSCENQTRHVTMHRGRIYVAVSTYDKTIGLHVHAMLSKIYPDIHVWA